MLSRLMSRMLGRPDEQAAAAFARRFLNHLQPSLDRLTTRNLSTIAVAASAATLGVVGIDSENRPQSPSPFELNDPSVRQDSVPSTPEPVQTNLDLGYNADRASASLLGLASQNEAWDLCPVLESEAETDTEIPTTPNPSSPNLGFNSSYFFDDEPMGTLSSSSASAPSSFWAFTMV